MSAFYTGLQSTAARLLGDKGMVMTLRKRVPGTYDPATGAAPITSTDYACTGAKFAFPALLIDGTTIRQGDQKVLLAAQGLAVEPEQGDVLVIAGNQWAVLEVKPIAPADVVVVWQIQVRS